MSKTKSIINQLVFYFFALLIVFLPFQRLLEQIFLFRFQMPPSLVFWSMHFYEPIIIIVLVIELLQKLFCHSRLARESTNDRLGHSELDSGSNQLDPRVKSKDDRKKSWTIFVTVALIILSIISIFVLSPSISRGIEGFRFTIFFLLAFLAAYFSGLDSKQSNKLINLYLIMAVVIALWAIFERFLPVNYLMKLKLIDPDSCFGYGTHRVGAIWQSVTAIGGPNQLGSYLLPAMFIALSRIMSLRGGSQKADDEAIYLKGLPQPTDRLPACRQAWRNDNLKLKMYLTVLVIFGIAAVILSFSRSAWVGLYAGFIIYLILFIKNIKLKVAGLAVLIIIAAFGVSYYLDQPSDLLTHGASSLSHQSALESSVAEIENRFISPLKLIFGSGIGTAGPAVLKYGDGFVSESWYLQLALELGFLGLILWFVLISLLLTDLFRKNKGLFLALIAVSITAIFLHTFADNPALSITLFLLIGLEIPSGFDRSD